MTLMTTSIFVRYSQNHSLYKIRIHKTFNLYVRKNQ